MIRDENRQKMQIGRDFIFSIKTPVKRNILWTVGTIFLMLCLCGIFFISDISAAQKRQVKVAFFPMDGYHIQNADGSYGGMDVEYLKVLCEYTDWEIEYVECESWEEALQLLRNRKVDLVGSAQYSDSRAATYDYADLSSGYTFGVIATNKESTIAYEDFEAMDWITFGMVKDYVRRDEFFQYLDDNGIENPLVLEYATTADLQNALSTGEIDAMVHTFTEVREGQRLVGRFAPRPFYYITYKGNEEVLYELNQATASLKMNHPELEMELMNEFYYSRFDKTALLTTEEMEYLKEKETLIVGYVDGFYPFSYEERGEFKGLARTLVEEGIGSAGIKLKYRRVSDQQAGETALQAGAIDVLAYCADSEEKLENYHLKKVCDYVSIPLVLVMERHTEVNRIETLATVPVLEDRASLVGQSGETAVNIYATQQASLDAVIDGEADASLCGGYLAEHLKRTDFGYENLQIKNVLSAEYAVTMAVRENDEVLSGILEKTTDEINPKEINAYMLKENTYPLISIADFIRGNSIKIIGVLFLIIILIFAVGIHMIRDAKKIQTLMYKDTNMDIWNMNYLLFTGEHKLLPDRKGEYAVVYINLSQFRRYSIIYGWSAGETLLEGIARILLKNTKEKTEVCARNQGDRFVMLLNFSDRKVLIERLRNLKDEVEDWILDRTDNHMSLHMGVYYVPKEVTDLHGAVAYASQAAEHMDDKQNEISIYDSALEDLLKEHHEREKILEAADINQDFVAYYQPKVDIRDGKIVGAEALVRFLNPAEDGAVKAPGYFVPYYEKTGKITEIDFFVYESVCKMLRRRLDAGLPVVPVSCNFSRMHFIKPGFPERFVRVLERYQISKDLIEIEITETLVVEELQHNRVKQTLDILNDMGIRLSIDDFGTGYSSLGVFEQIPASVIKLDRSFLLNKEDRGRQVKIMRGIVQMSETLGAQLVCEGVETEADISLMKEIGAYVAQGYFYSKPVPEVEFEAKLR